MKGVKKVYGYVYGPNQSGSSWDSPPGVAPWEVQFQDTVIEHKQYYDEKCMSHSRLYYYCTQSLQ